MSTLVDSNSTSADLKSFVSEYLECHSITQRSLFALRLSKSITEYNAASTDLSIVILRMMQSHTMTRWFPLFGICLRSNFNPNSYHVISEIGNVHHSIACLQHLIAIQASVETLVATLQLLSFVGANFEFDVEADNGKLTIREWLAQRNLRVYDTIKFFELHSNYRRIFAILLDRPSLIKANFGTATNEEFASILLGRSFRTGELLCETAISKRRLHKLIRTAAAELFIALLNRRQIQPSYIEMNQLCLELCNYLRLQNSIGATQLLNMLLAAISAGVTLDEHQISMIASIDDLTARNLRQDYATPLWRKLCFEADTEQVVIGLRPLAIATSLIRSAALPSNRFVCEQLEILSMTSAKQLRMANRSRQEQRLGSLATLPQAYIEQIPKLPMCYNSRDLVSPYDFGDLQSLAYTSPNMERLWCYSAPRFEDLVSSRVNPSTLTPLPSDFVEAVAARLKLFKELGVNWSTLPSLPVALESLNAADEISNTLSDNVMLNLEHLLDKSGIPLEYLEALSVEDLEESLHEIRIVDKYFAVLTASHARVTFAYHIKEYPERFGDVVQALKRRQRQDLSRPTLRSNVTRSLTTWEPIVLESL